MADDLINEITVLKEATGVEWVVEPSPHYPRLGTPGARQRGEQLSEEMSRSESGRCRGDSAPAARRPPGRRGKRRRPRRRRRRRRRLRPAKRAAAEEGAGGEAGAAKKAPARAAAAKRPAAKKTTGAPDAPCLRGTRV